MLEPYDDPRIQSQVPPEYLSDLLDPRMIVLGHLLKIVQHVLIEVRLDEGHSITTKVLTDVKGRTAVIT